MRGIPIHKGILLLEVKNFFHIFISEENYLIVNLKLPLIVRWKYVPTLFVPWFMHLKLNEKLCYNFVWFNPPPFAKILNKFRKGTAL